MKPILVTIFLFLTSVYFVPNVFAQLGTPQTNQITIRNDRVFTLNGQPFFPIMVSHELGPDNFNCQLKRPQDGKLYGFNLLNLHKQVKWIFRCFSNFDNCSGINWSYCDPNYKGKNAISGDLNTGGYYYNILNPMGWDITYDANANRIFDYVNNANPDDPTQNFYIISDDLPFFPSTISHYVQNCGSSCCGDYLPMIPRVNQNERNSAIDRVNSLAIQNNSKLIGFFSMDDANMMQTFLESADCVNQNGSYFSQYYFDNIDQQINELTATYDYAKSVYPNSIVYMAAPPVYYPRALDPANWGNVPLSTIRTMWKDVAHRLAGASDVMYAMFYNFESPGWGANWRIYDGDGRPSWYLEHMDVMKNEIIGKYDKPKALLGGYWIDGAGFLPQNDSYMERKLKWATYVSLAKGATGLNFFGWHLGKYYEMSAAWESTKRIVDTLVNEHHLNEKVFTKTNLGQVGHTLTGSNVPSNITYAVYQTNNNWNDYYLLVNNNPIGNMNGPVEANNLITINTDVNLCLYDIKEVFSNNTVTPFGYHYFNYIFPWFGTALFHIKLKNPLPNDCPDEKPGKIEYLNIPDKYFIDQNYPNPFNPQTEIRFGLPQDGFVRIDIYNSIGQLISTITNEFKTAGYHTVIFDGLKLASGVYIYKINADNFTETKKMLLIK